MALKVFTVTVDKGPPSEPKVYLYSGREGAMIGAVHEALSAVQKSNVRKGPFVIRDFLDAAAREQWEDAYSLLPRVFRVLAGRGFPRIEVKRRDAIDDGETDEAAVATLALGLLSHFEEA
jgi:hypothetical protein